MKVETPTTRRIPTQVFALKTNFSIVVIMLLTILMSNSQSVWDAQHCHFPNQTFWLRRLRPYSVIQNDFISLWILYESCSLIHVDEFGFFNHLISITEAQDIPFWISSMKVENHVARRFPAEFCYNFVL